MKSLLLRNLMLPVYVLQMIFGIVWLLLLVVTVVPFRFVQWLWRIKARIPGIVGAFWRTRNWTRRNMIK